MMYIYVCILQNFIEIKKKELEMLRIEKKIQKLTGI